MNGTTVWMRFTAIAMLVIPVLDVLVRFTVPGGWIFAFVFFLGAPVWLLAYGLLFWMSLGMLRSDSTFAAAPKAPRTIIATLVWAYLACMTFFCLFMSDGGDADYWQSPGGHLFGVELYDSSAPEFLRTAEDLAVRGLPLGFLALLAAAICYGVLVAGNRRRRYSAPSEYSVSGS
ncbi:hypothetical protein H0264_11640 [Nocardia huaxiensis]|uniref:Uncharacterized protein n=1 Tax=Nocardia huaxiensis TaxID=2755382 RepID=A0A7D6ZDD2_9NOCA|nr:hypothetical protein [Nocardia huaxiensis]QLY32808.1 hypothetical protein H0264_11640 [Nocardia huaxiensis]